MAPSRLALMPLLLLLLPAVAAASEAASVFEDSERASLAMAMVGEGRPGELTVFDSDDRYVWLLRQPAELGSSQVLRVGVSRDGTVDAVEKLAADTTPATDDNQRRALACVAKELLKIRTQSVSFGLKHVLAAHPVPGGTSSNTCKATLALDQGVRNLGLGTGGLTTPKWLSECDGPLRSLPNLGQYVRKRIGCWSFELSAKAKVWEMTVVLSLPMSGQQLRQVRAVSVAGLGTFLVADHSWDQGAAGGSKPIHV